MLKIRRPLGRLIFNMGIAIPGKTVFLIETAPWFTDAYMSLGLDELKKRLEPNSRHKKTNGIYGVWCHICMQTLGLILLWGVTLQHLITGGWQPGQLGSFHIVSMGWGGAPGIMFCWLGHKIIEYVLLNHLHIFSYHRYFFQCFTFLSTKYNLQVFSCWILQCMSKFLFQIFGLYLVNW